MKINLPKHPQASDRLIRDLIFEARQRKMWADYLKNKGNNGEAMANLRKSNAAVKSLKSMGYTANIFN